MTMRATLELLPYTLPMTRPLVTARGRLLERRGVVVVARCGEEQGLGEAAPIPGFSVESPAEVHAALAAASLGDIPEDADAICEIVERLDLPPAAAHGLEQALLDLAARRAGVPLARLLRADAVVRVAVARLVADAEDAWCAVTAGACTVKLKVGSGDLAADLARVGSVRSAIGDVPLRLDANGRWSRAEAAEAIAALAQHRPACIEEPLAGRDVVGMAALRGSVPLAADESVRGLSDLRAILALDAADAVVVKPMCVGSLVVAVRMVEQARRAGLQAWLSTALDGAIGRAGALHAAAAVGGSEAHGLDTADWLAEDLGDGVPAEDGTMALPGGPGLGVTLCGSLGSPLAASA